MPEPKGKRKPRVQAGVDALTGKDSARSVRKGYTYDTDGVVQPQATPRRENTPEESARAGSRWGTIRGKIEESKAFNEGTTPTKSPLESDKTTTAGGAWLASQVASKEKIGSVDDYMGSPGAESESLQSEHLKQFREGAHAFITFAAHKRIHGTHEDGWNWGAWGQDANFVSTLADADQLIKDASADGGRGIFHLEDELGIKPGDWVKGCEPDYTIYRYIVLDTKAEGLNLRVPSGSEDRAYESEWQHDKAHETDENDTYIAGQWQPKGKTEGGKAEAVIDGMKLDSLKELEKSGAVKLVAEKSLADNTRRVLEERRTDTNAKKSLKDGDGPVDGASVDGRAQSPNGSSVDDPTTTDTQR